MRCHKADLDHRQGLCTGELAFTQLSLVPSSVNVLVTAVCGGGGGEERRAERTIPTSSSQTQRLDMPSWFIMEPLKSPSCKTNNSSGLMDVDAAFNFCGLVELAPLLP